MGRGVGQRIFLLRIYAAINKEVDKAFLYNSCLLYTIFFPFYLLFVTLWNAYINVLRTALWLKMWSKRFSSFAGDCLPAQICGFLWMKKQMRFFVANNPATVYNYEKALYNR